MARTPLAIVVLAICLLGTAACGPNVDLSKALDVTDVLNGYYDAGLKDGKNYLRPSISFRLHNRGDGNTGPVQVTVAFWVDGSDAGWDEVVVQAIHAGGLAPGAATESILARAKVGYTLEGSRAEFFNHHLFKDVTAKLFASQSGQIIPIGQFKLERTIIPHLD